MQTNTITVKSGQEMIWALVWKGKQASARMQSIQQEQHRGSSTTSRQHRENRQIVARNANSRKRASERASVRIHAQFADGGSRVGLRRAVRAGLAVRLRRSVLTKEQARETQARIDTMSARRGEQGKQEVQRGVATRPNGQNSKQHIRCTRGQSIDD
jgi:hypothetical protein